MTNYSTKEERTFMYARIQRIERQIEQLLGATGLNTILIKNSGTKSFWKILSVENNAMQDKLTDALSAAKAIEALIAEKINVS